MADLASSIIICSICFKEIKEKDSYVHVIDYKEGELYKEGYYHNSCYNESLGRGRLRLDLQKAAASLLVKAAPLIKKAEDERYD